MKVLMVCLGNICRSPIAEGVLQQKVKQLGLHWEVDSAGTNGFHNGERPHDMSQMVSKLNGIDISEQRSRAFKAEDDPWGRSVAAFHEVFSLIDHACDALIKQYQSPKQP